MLLHTKTRQFLVDCINCLVANSYLFTYISMYFIYASVEVLYTHAKILNGNCQ